MGEHNFALYAADGTELHCYCRIAEHERAVVQLVHGMAEHAGRYRAFAGRMIQSGYTVYADDHRGHGRSAVSLEDLGYMAQEDGFSHLVEDEKCMNEYIRAHHPGKPILLLGHSMGSFAAQRYFQLYGNSIDALLLTGTNAFPERTVAAGAALAGAIMRVRGRRYKSILVDRLAFSAYNSKIPHHTGRYDWLTRDGNALDEYLRDPYCGALVPVSFYYDLFRGILTIAKEENGKKIPTDRPVYIFCGGADPVGDYGRGPSRLYNRYAAAGVRDVSLRIYPDARHELLHELNRAQVCDDLVAYLQSRGF